MNTTNTYQYYKYFNIIFCLLICILGYLFIGLLKAHAQTYPIPELGNCRDQKECKLYCDIPQNTPACWSYGKYVLSTQVLGDQTTSDQAMAQKYNITFPIAELGNCASVQACKTFCDSPTNRDTCINFAKQKGFYKETQTAQPNSSSHQQELLTAAKAELGCDSIDTCKALCQDQTNFDKCQKFAKAHGVDTHSNSGQNKTLEDAKKELGCTSMESCKAFCEQHHETCMDFARRHGLDTGQKSGSPSASMQKPSNCNSQESCRKYCEEHPGECKGFKERQELQNQSNSKQTLHPDMTFEQYRSATSQGSYLGPGGCKIEEECKAYCLAHPTDCPGFPKIYSTQTATTPYPTSYNYTGQNKTYPSPYQQSNYYPTKPSYPSGSPPQSPSQYPSPTQPIQ